MKKRGAVLILALVLSVNLIGCVNQGDRGNTPGPNISPIITATPSNPTDPIIPTDPVNPTDPTISPDGQPTITPDDVGGRGTGGLTGNGDDGAGVNSPKGIAGARYGTGLNPSYAGNHISF